MSKKLIVALTVLSFAFAGVTFAAVENIKVSGDITAQGITRNLACGSETAGTKDAEDFLLSQIRLRFDADLTEGVSAVIQLLNEGMWGVTDSYGDEDQLDLDLAYIALQEFLYQPLTLIVGRQNLRYGNGLIVGDPDTNQLVTTTALSDPVFADLSIRKSFDALRAILDFAPYTLDIIYAKITENDTNEIDDQTLVGANLAYEWNSYNGVTEGYIFWSDGRERGSTQIQENEDYTLTIGARTQLDLNDNLTLGLEAAHQFGDCWVSGIDEKPRDAWAVQLNSEYRFLDDSNAKIGASYTYLTGDDDPDDKESNAWDPLFEDQSPAEILNIFLSNSNAQFITLSGSIMPREDVTLGLLYTHARLNKHISSLSGVTGSAISGNTYSVKNDEKHFGDEIDIYALYDYTEDVQIKLSSAFFIPGDVFEKANDNTAYSLRAGLSVSF